MANLSATQIKRIRRKIGDNGIPQEGGEPKYAFQDSEIQDEYDDAGGDFNKTILALYEDLLGNAWRFHDYTQNQSDEKKQQIFKNLESAAQWWRQKVTDDAATVQTATNVARIVGIEYVPPVEKSAPEGWD